jgi:hypothetical protein
MADVREVFTVLEDPTSQAGLPLHKVAEGVAVSGKNALPALVFKDQDLEFVYPQLDADGRILVTTEAVGATAELTVRGELAAGAATMSLITGAEITLQADLVYKNVGFIVSCLRDAHFQIIQLDDAAETILADVLVGAGCFSHSEVLTGLNFTAGSTGTQKIQLKGMNFNAQSALRGSLTVVEIQP